MRYWLVIGCSAIACVSVKQHIEPVPSAPLGLERHPSSVPPQIAASKEDELSKAFSPSPPEGQRAVKGQAPAALPDPRKPFLDAMAARETDAATGLSNQLTGVERWRAYELAFNTTSNDPARRDAALSWRSACGPEKLDACRAAATTAMSRLKPFAKQAAALKAADTCVAQGEAKNRPNACFATVERTDDVAQARIGLIRANIETSEARKVALLERVVELCERVQCATPRRKALSALIGIDLKGKKKEAALIHLFKDTAIAASMVPEAERAWVRPQKLDALCAQYDQTEGPGACRRLEKQTIGRWSFKDFGATGTKGATGLTTDQVKLVNEHYSPPLQACLAEQARRLVAPDSVEYEVRWVVVNDGRVGEVHLPPDAENSPLAACVRRQFGLWRYPKFEGEWQNVQQKFTVTAVSHAPVQW